MKWLASCRTLIATALAVFLPALMFSGCDLMEVSNPNSLVEEDLDNPRGASGLKNGVLNATMDGMGWIYAPISTASDEMRWIGSYESYQNFQIGRLSGEGNEITNNAFPELAEARWLSDEAIDRLTTLEDEGELSDPTILTKTYLYSALNRINIADNFDNFVYSDKQEAGEPIGEDNMDQVYDEAINHLDRAVDRAQANGNSTLEMQALGLRARAKHAKAVWQKLNPAGSVDTSDPLVSDALSASASDAVGDAEAALAMMETDYKARFDYRGPQIQNYIAQQTNSRNEITFNDPPNDPKTGDPDPRVVNIIEDFEDTESYTELYSPLTWLSAREMRLIIAEEALGRSESEAITALNELRDLNDLPDVGSGDDLVEILEHERRANLFLQGRRLNDMYRFGTQSPTWQPGEDAIEAPGTLLPIPSNEIAANPNL